MRGSLHYAVPDETGNSFGRDDGVWGGGEFRRGASLVCCQWAAMGRKLSWNSDALVVGAPVDDGLLDGLGVHVFGEGSVGEVGEFGVGGEA